MIAFDLPQRARNILCLGAHADDIEIGCGGTLLRWIEKRPDLRIYWVVFAAEGRRVSEARASAKTILGKAAEKVVVKQFRMSFLPFHGREDKRLL